MLSLKEISLLGQGCTSSVAQCNSLRMSSVLERVLGVKQLLCTDIKGIYLAGTSPSLIFP